VDAADVVRVRNAVGLAAAIDASADFDRDGFTGAADLVAARNRVGLSLPPPPSATSAVFGRSLIRFGVRREENGWDEELFVT
jgi:hypothetical protein